MGTTREAVVVLEADHTNSTEGFARGGQQHRILAPFAVDFEKVADWDAISLQDFGQSYRGGGRRAALFYSRREGSLAGTSPQPDLA
jgi:hypothetical protein